MGKGGGMMEKPHTANEPILLLETDLTEIAGQSGEWPVRIILELLPTPRLLLMLDDCPGIVFKDTPRSFEVSGRDLGSIEVIRPDSSRIYDQGNGTVTYRRTLTAKREPCVVVDDDEPLVSVDFSLFNLPKFFGLHDRWHDADGVSRRLGVLELQASCWEIDIAETVDCNENRKLLDANNGYAITHTGTISHKNGLPFSAQEAGNVLRGVWLFLSFAAGGYCGIPIAEGKNKSGQTSWLRLGTAATTPWLSMSRSWWRTVGGGDDLESVFQGFWDCFSDSASKDIIDDAMRWYLASNVESLTSGLVLGQVALEKLAGLSHRRNRGSNEYMGDFIAAAVKKWHISRDAPASLSEWRQLKECKGWKHAPQGLIAIRNDLVHFEPRLGPLSDDRLYDAWNIGHWYIEMLLLSMFRYRGQYRNLLTGEYEELSPCPMGASEPS